MHLLPLPIKEELCQHGDANRIVYTSIPKALSFAFLLVY
jgi:hypothetical protein